MNLIKKTLSEVYSFVSSPMTILTFVSISFLLTIGYTLVNTEKQRINQKACSNLVGITSFSEETFQHKYLADVCVLSLKKDEEMAVQQDVYREYRQFVNCLSETKSEEDLKFCNVFYQKSIEVKNRN